MFDPYHRWLGIPKDARPPTHYQMLGLAAGESDHDVIEEAAIRQTTHLRAYQIGEHAALCTKLLNEVATAKMALLNPAKKQAYDQQLARRASAAEATQITAQAPARPPVDFDEVTEVMPTVIRRPRSVKKQSSGLLIGAIAATIGVVLLLSAVLAFILLRDRPQAVAVVPVKKEKLEPAKKPEEKRPAPIVAPMDPPQNEQPIKPPPKKADDDKPAPPPKKGGGGFGFTIYLKDQNSQDFAWNPDRSVVAIATSPVRLLDGRTYKIVDTIADPGNRLTNVRRVAFARDGSKLLIGCGNYGGALGVYDVATRNLQIMSDKIDGKSGNYVLSAALAGDARWIVSTHPKGMIRVFDAGSGTVARALDADGAAQNGCRFLGNGRTFVTGGEDGALRFWNVETGALEKRVDVPPVAGDAKIACLEVSPDDSIILIGQGNQMRRYYPRGGAFNPTNLKLADPISGVAFSADGNLWGGVDQAGHFTLVNERARFTYTGQVHLTKVHALGFGPDREAVWFAGQQGVAPLPFTTLKFPGN